MIKDSNILTETSEVTNIPNQNKVNRSGYMPVDNMQKLLMNVVILVLQYH